jgi:ABC-type multidrug transport system ATPase subunit
MRYVSFEIRNFKGVQATSISVPTGQRRAISLIGLNESGKTTLLEAIYSFSPDRESEPLFANDALLPDKTNRIPRDQLFSFNGRISVSATLGFYPSEKEELLKKIGTAIGGSVNPSSLPDLVQVTDWSEYKNSNFVKSGIAWHVSLKVRTGKQQIWRSASSLEWQKAVPILRQAIPSIAYFPTFLSEIPKRVYLRGHDDDKSNTFYRKVFQDILYQIGHAHTIKSQILDRIDDEEETSLSKLIAAFWGSPKRGMVQQLIDKAGAILSKVITDRWNEIFKTKPAGREIVINFGLEESEDGSQVEPYIEFAIKDGSNRYNVADRSLGFRWFFCFLLFTQFRAKRQGGSGTLFLFDEPASNLHAKAQEKLLDSFDDVSSAPNALVYSTHSPYMINPVWLDQAFVIENTLVGSELKDIGEMSVTEDSNILALPYKSYVDKYPDRISHFQPILDRLEVKPSVGELAKKTLLKEGKSDYAIIKGLAEGTKLKFNIVPAHGATTLGALIGLLRGWNWPFAVLLDSDKEGAKAATRYKEEFSLERELIVLGDVSPQLKEIESFLSEADRLKIQGGKGGDAKPTKKAIYQFFVDNSGTISEMKLDASKSPEFKKLIGEVEAIIAS